MKNEMFWLLLLLLQVARRKKYLKTKKRSIPHHFRCTATFVLPFFPFIIIMIEVDLSDCGNTKFYQELSLS